MKFNLLKQRSSFIILNIVYILGHYETILATLFNGIPVTWPKNSCFLEIFGSASKLSDTFHSFQQCENIC